MLLDRKTVIGRVARRIGTGDRFYDGWLAGRADLESTGESSITMLTRLVSERNVGRAQPVFKRDAGPYSARNTSKGALIEEAARVFGAFSSGLPIEDVREQVLHGTLLSQRSSQNRKRIWTLLQQRYITSGLPWLTALLIETSSQGAHRSEFVSLLYVLYALRDRLTFEFVTTVLWPKGSGSAVSRIDVLDLLKAATSQPQIDRWTESTRNKLAGSVLTALRDFGVLEGRQKKRLVRPRLPLSTAAALLRLMVTEGRRGRGLLEDPAWRLFLLTDSEVAQVLARLDQEGTIRFEKAGSTVILETPAEWEIES
jgi:hypothetical protein